MGKISFCFGYVTMVLGLVILVGHLITSTENDYFPVKYSL